MWIKINKKCQKIEKIKNRKLITKFGNISNESFKKYELQLHNCIYSELVRKKFHLPSN